MDEEQLLDLDRQGLIPGPNEGEVEFNQRATYCLALKNHISKELHAHFGEELGGDDSLDDALISASKKYHMAPAWIPIFFSNYKLLPWHGGCAWILKMEENLPTCAILQLRQKLKKSKNFFLIYSREELMVHEFAHVGRMMFEEPKYEEFLAYQSSPSKFRRYFGSLVQSSAESLVFTGVLGLIFLLDLFLFLSYPQFLSLVMPLKLIPLALISFALIRLWIRHSVYQRTLKACTEVLGSEEKAAAMAYRLTDQEMIDFSKMGGEQILEYAKRQSTLSLRWRALFKIFFAAGYCRF